MGDLTARGDQDTKKDEPRKPPTAGMPPAEDAAKLLGSGPYRYLSTKTFLSFGVSQLVELLAGSACNVVFQRPTLLPKKA